MIDVVNFILERCGISLEKAVQTNLFASLLKREKRISKLKAGSDREIAYRVGHLRMGRLLNSLSEKEALMVARSINEKEYPSNQERALIHFCGHAIVEGAKDCLPEEILEMVDEWKKGSEEDQIRIIRRLFFEFQSESQESKGDMSFDAIYISLLDRIRRRQEGMRAYLPMLYGRWNKKNCVANCQGKTQMLLAFARLVGAEALIVHSIIHAKEKFELSRIRIRDMVAQDLKERDLEDGSKLFSEGILASQFEDLINFDPNYFHVGIIIRIKNGSWVMIDPHGLSWGPIGEDWSFSNSYRIIRKYKNVLPGLTMISGNENTGADIIQEKIDLAEELIRRSCLMEKRISCEVRSIMDLVRVISESEDVELLMGLDSAEHGRDPIDYSDPEIRNIIATTIVVGDDLSNLMSLFFQREEGYLQKRIKSWLTFYHACAMNLFLNEESFAGKMIHPLCEVSYNPEWSIAVSAINSANIDLGGKFNNDFFVRNSFDQTTLFNGLNLEGSLGIAVRETLSSLRYLHPLCARRLG